MCSLTHCAHLRTVIATLSALVGVLVVLFVTDIPRDEQRSMLQIVIQETPRLESWTLK